jgi:hypothetical protein
MEPLKYWTLDGFDVTSYKWKLYERINKKFNGSGSDKSEKCLYSYNEYGFRGDSVHKEGFKIMSIGCSLTEGVGVNDNETWPHLFSQLVPNSVNLNFGMGGRSNDFISRCLITFFDTIKPDLVLIMYTYPHRSEFYTEDGGIEPYIPGVEWGYMEETEKGREIQNNLSQIQNNNQDYINWYKNHLLIKYFLENKKCNWLWNGSNLFDSSLNEFNRYDGDYCKLLDYGADGKHPGVQHNMNYSKKLFNHIKKNLRDYLPNEIIDIKDDLV